MVDQQHWTLTTFGRKERHKGSYKGQRGKGKVNYKGRGKGTPPWPFKERWGNKGKGNYGHNYSKDSKGQKNVKETTTTSKEKEHTANAAGAATTLQNAEWHFGNYMKESLKKTTITRWKRSTHKIGKTTQLQTMQMPPETVGQNRMGLQSSRTRLVELRRPIWHIR